MRQYKLALIVGRFQPFHKGHLFLVKKTLEKADKIIFGIGSANIHDEYNPLSYEKRKKMLLMMIKNEKIEDRVIDIVPLDDYYDDEKWLKNVYLRVKQIDLVVGNSEWVNRILEKAGYKVWRLGYYQKRLYEGWRVRELIKQEGEFKDRVPAYLISFIISNFEYRISKQVSNFQKPIFQFNHSILGGTFDHFHKGHEEFIKTALSQTSRLTIGLTTEKFYKDKFLSQSIEDYKTRKRHLISFFKQQKCLDKVKIIQLVDIYGSGNKEEKIDAIFATEDTYAGALAINRARRERGWSLLKIIRVPMVKAEDGNYITSERIRMGEIDRAGRVYINFFRRTLTLPDDLKQELRKPFGEVQKVIKLTRPVMIITVGDIISREVNKLGIEADIKIIDFKTRRRRILDSKSEVSSKSQATNNRQGTINDNTVVLIKKFINDYLCTGKKHTFVINGEEDLLTIPAILLAPLNSIVLYGQYGLGAIVVKVTEQKKKLLGQIIKKFI